MREVREKVFGWLIQSWVSAVAKKRSAMTKFFVGSGCCPLKTRKAEPGDEAGQDQHFHAGRLFQSAKQLVTGAPSPRFLGGQSAADQLTALKKIEQSHFTCASPARASDVVDRH